jgi:hypothetical protein
LDAFEQALAIELCRRDAAYFLSHFGHIYDSDQKRWIPFELWPFQRRAIQRLNYHQYSIWLKTRQIGCTWKGIGYGLWQMLFHPISHGLYFSLRSTEAEILISPERMRGMYQRLPDWLLTACQADTAIDNVAHWQLANGSSAKAFASGRGDSYTATYAMLDEADLMPNLDATLTSVNPTIEAGGRLLMLSRINKRTPKSHFRQIWKAARLGQNVYDPTFFGWQVHPKRDHAWYERMTATFVHKDELWEQYPATEQEALAMGSQGLVYPNFFIERNVSELADYDPAYPVEWWVDVGYTNPTAILFCQWRPFDGKPDHAVVFDMIYLTQQLPRHIIELALDTKPYSPPSVMGYDSAAPFFAAEFAKVRLERGLLTSIRASHKGIDENIKNVRNYIGDAHLPNLLQIHPRCAMLIEELLALHYKETGSQQGGDYRPVSEDDHAENALQYFLAQRKYRITLPS